MKIRNLRGFANILAEWYLKEYHDLHPKVVYSKAHAANYAYKALLMGCNENQIKGAYYNALEEINGIATIAQTSGFAPSGVVYLALKRLKKHTQKSKNS